MKRIPPILAAITLPTGALAKSPAWFGEGAEAVTIDARVDVPLIRGPETQGRPAVEVKLGEVAGLAIVDLGNGWTRIGRERARALGISTSSVDTRDGWVQYAVIPQLTVAGASFEGIHAEVVAGDELVLGFGTLDEVAIALLPSKGMVSITSSDNGQWLLAEVGTPQKVTQQTSGVFKVGDEKVRGNGLTMAIGGVLGEQQGLIAIDTARTDSRAARSFPIPGDIRRQGVLAAMLGGKLGEVRLPRAWMVRDESYGSNDKRFLGALGYGHLYGLDLAHSPRHGLLSLASASAVKWEDATPYVRRAAQAAYEAAGYEIVEENDRPPRMGFDAEAESHPEGDPGDDKRRGIELAVGEALWRSGRLQEALQHLLQAAKVAGDNCDAHFDLGLKRQAWSGELQQQVFIRMLIRQPFERAGEIWELWASLPPATREKIRNYKNVPSGTFKIAQDERCRTAHGHLMASALRQGDTKTAAALYQKMNGVDPLITYVRGLEHLSAGEGKAAEAPIRAALVHQLSEHQDIKLGLGVAQAQQGKLEPLQALAGELVAFDERPLAGALLAASWGAALEKDGGRGMVGRMLSADADFLPARILAVHLEQQKADDVRKALTAQVLRSAGAPRARLWEALLQAVEGKHDEALTAIDALIASSPPATELFVGRAWIQAMAGDTEGLDKTLFDLSLRFPTLALGDADVLLSVR